MISRFLYDIDGEYPSKPSVYKCYFGKSFFIWKAKALQQGLSLLSRDLDIKFRKGYKEGDILSKMVDYVKKYRVSRFTVEVLHQTDDAAELLAFEAAELNRCFGSPLCLNVSNELYLPKWIPLGDIERFKATIQETDDDQIDQEEKAIVEPVIEPVVIPAAEPVLAIDVPEVKQPRTRKRTPAVKIDLTKPVARTGGKARREQAKPKLKKVADPVVNLESTAEFMELAEALERRSHGKA